MSYFKIKNTSNAEKKLWENWQTPAKTILNKFQNGERKGSNTLRLLLNFTLEGIQQHSNRRVA